MPLTWLRVEQFRCLERVEIDLDDVRLRDGEPAERHEEIRDEAKALFHKMGETFKVEAIDDILKEGYAAEVVELTEHALDAVERRRGLLCPV